MDIVSQKQTEIEQLKERLFELERMKSLEKQQEMFANQLIETLREQNIQMQKTIAAIHNHQMKLEELDYLKVQINELRKKNMQLEQAKSDLCSEIINVQSQVFRMNQWRNRDLSRTNWGDSLIDSRRESETNSYSQSRPEENSFVAPTLIDSRYTSNQNQNKEQSQAQGQGSKQPQIIHEQVAHPIHILSDADWNARVVYMTGSNKRRVY